MARLCLFPLLFWSLLLHVLSTSGLLGIQNGACRYRKWEKPGDVKLLVLAGLHEKQGEWCGDLSNSVVSMVAGIEWTLSLLNGQAGQDPYLSGLSVGYDLYDTCDSVARTTDILYSVRDASMECTDYSNITDVYIGAISLTTDESTLVACRLLHGLPIVRPLQPSPLLDQANARNLFQTVVSFDKEARAIRDVLRAMEWTLVAIIHSDDTFGKAAAQVVNNFLKASEICVNITGKPTDQTVRDLYSTLSREMHKKTITVIFLGSVFDALEFFKLDLLKSTNAPHNSVITWLFTSHVATNPEVLNAILQRNNRVVSDRVVSIGYKATNLTSFNMSSSLDKSPLKNITNARIENRFTPVAIDNVVDAVTILVHAAKSVYTTRCPAANGTVCNDFNTSLNTNNVITGFSSEDINITYRPLGHAGRSVKFSDFGDRVDMDLEIRINNPPQQEQLLVGMVTQSGEYIHKTSTTGLPTSACAHECLYCVRHLDLRYSYLPGDVLILGLFTLHTFQDSPFSCGAIRREIDAPMTVSAFMESIRQKQSTTGIKYGGIAIDDCYLGMNTTNLLGDLFSKKLILKDPLTQNDIDFDDVFMIVGAFSSPVTIVVADMATSLRLPMISYSASSPELDNRDRYPYFRRTVPSDTLQAKGIVDLIISLNVTRVGAIYLDDNYGQAGIYQIMQYAKVRHLCVENPIKVSQDDTLKGVLDKLYNELRVRMVIFFGIDSIALKLVEIIEESGVYKENPLYFVASEGWGTNQNLISIKNGLITKGSIVFSTGAPSVDMTAYHSFLRNLTVSSYANNRWIPTKFEDVFKCNFLSSFEKFASSDSVPICTEDRKSATLDNATIESLVKDQWAVHTILAVNAGIEAFSAYCQNKSNTNCSPQYIRNGDDLRQFMARIDNVKMGNKKLFDVDGNGDIGYTIFNIQRDSKSTSNVSYKIIGNYTKEGLNMPRSPVFYDKFHDSISSLSGIDELYCNGYSTCSSVCISSGISSSTPAKPYPVTPAPENSTDTTLLVVVIITGTLTVVLAAALIIVICLLLRRSNALYEMSKQMAFHDRRRAPIRQSQDNIYHIPKDAENTICKQRHKSGKYDNPSFDITDVTPVSGNSSSSLELNPIQYADISQTSLNILPKKHRQPATGNQLSVPNHTHQWSDLGPNTETHPKWADLGRTWKRPGSADQLDDFHSTRSLSPAMCTPRSAPVQSRAPTSSVQDCRPRTKSSPTFRFSPLRNQPTRRIRREKRGSQDTEDDRRLESEASGHTVSGNARGVIADEEENITYLSAKDFVNTSSDDEDSTMHFSTHSNSLTQGSDDTRNTLKSVGYDPNLISPLNDEVIGFTYAEDRNSSGSANVANTTHKTFKPVVTKSKSPRDSPGKSNKETFVDSLGDSFLESPVDEGVFIDDVRDNNKKLPTGGHRSSSAHSEGQKSKSGSCSYGGSPALGSPGISSINDVPDIIKHRAYDEENVFII